jgi:hypothetical protein
MLLLSLYSRERALTVNDSNSAGTAALDATTVATANSALADAVASATTARDLKADQIDLDAASSEF